MLLKIIRFIVGKIILALNEIFVPTPMTRSVEHQNQVDRETASLVIYQFEACPFCVKVRRVIKKLNLKIALRDASKVPAYGEELVKGGGTLQVPCLRIPEGQNEEGSNGKFRWMYESSDIIAYLESRFSGIDHK